MSRSFNFSAGPAALPQDILKESIALHEQAQADLRETSPKVARARAYDLLNLQSHRP